MNKQTKEQVLDGKTYREQLEIKAHWALWYLSNFFEKVHDPLFYKVNTLLRQLDEIRGAQPSYKCPYCGMVSYHPDDIKNQYCGACHKFAGWE